jgi:hypothetical protein
MTTEQTPEQKQLAVEVAKDVLKTLAENNGFIPKTCSGFVIPAYQTEDALEGISNSKIQAAILKKGECGVCALGACLVSLVSMRNEFDFLKPSGGVMIVKRLTQIFTPEQCALIECAFECVVRSSAFIVMNLDIDVLGYPIFETDEMDQKVRLAVAFGSQYHTSRDRLIAIMENIIHNNGDFIPVLV